jgi:hypothetical protein
MPRVTSPQGHDLGDIDDPQLLTYYRGQRYLIEGEELPPLPDGATVEDAGDSSADDSTSGDEHDGETPDSSTFGGSQSSGGLGSLELH